MSDESISSAELMKSEPVTDEAAVQADETGQHFDQDQNIASAVYWNRVNQYRSREAPQQGRFLE
jgi:hypothetical protein